MGEGEGYKKGTRMRSNERGVSAWIARFDCGKTVQRQKNKTKGKKRREEEEKEGKNKYHVGQKQQKRKQDNDA